MHEAYLVGVTEKQRGNGHVLLQGFSDFLFKLYLDEGHLNQLLSFSEDFPTELGTFLKPHLSLSWLHDLAIRDYGSVRVYFLDYEFGTCTGH